MRGLDLMMSMDINNDWIRESNNTARRKTAYEKLLEQHVAELKSEIRYQKQLTLWQLIRRKLADKGDVE